MTSGLNYSSSTMCKENSFWMTKQTLKSASISSSHRCTLGCKVARKILILVCKNFWMNLYVMMWHLNSSSLQIRLIVEELQLDKAKLLKSSLALSTKCTIYSTSKFKSALAQSKLRCFYRTKICSVILSTWLRWTKILKKYLWKWPVAISRLKNLRDSSQCRSKSNWRRTWSLSMAYFLRLCKNSWCRRKCIAWTSRIVAWTSETNICTQVTTKIYCSTLSLRSTASIWVGVLSQNELAYSKHWLLFHRYSIYKNCLIRASRCPKNTSSEEWSAIQKEGTISVSLDVS